MKIAERQCGTCGAYTPEREIADDEVCACGSRICLLQSAAICITTHRPRTGTRHKGLDAPPRNRMVAMPAVKK